MKKPKLKQILSILLWIVIPIASLAVFWTYHKSPNHQLFGKIVSHVETNDRVIALTFDDGPFPGQTEKVLEILDQYQVKATFFLNGDPMAKFPELAPEIIRRGHQIGNHSYSHDIMLFRSQTWLKHELGDTDSLIRAAGYQGDITFRPPYGKKFITLPFYLWQNDYTTVTWDVDADSGGGTKEEIMDKVLSQTKPGSIILMHVLVSSRKASREALPEIIERLREKGYRFVLLDELL